MMDKGFPLLYFKAKKQKNRREKMKRLLTLILVLALTLGAMTSCSMDEIAAIVDEIMSAIIPTVNPHEPPEDTWADGYDIITVAEALELCGEEGNITSQRYYIRGTVTAVTNATYGSMTVEDETGSITVYGSGAEDGTSYDQMSEKPFKGDEVILACVLQNYKGTKEVKHAIIVKFRTPEKEVDTKDYTEMTIAEARETAKGTKVHVKGVVARIAYATKMVPTGVIIVDGTQSIYVYDKDLAGRVKVGDQVDILASKTYWILEDETANAAKFGYKGGNQLEDVTVVEIYKSNSEFDKSWIPETTVKELLDTPVTEDITSSIYKVTALIKKVPDSGFINYYFYDIDGETGTYVYTLCNGSDFAWLDEFDGKICTVYLTALNAKSTKSDCYFRLLPVEVIYENYTFNTDEAAKYAVKYHGVGQFLPQYTGNPEIELLPSVSSELLGFQGATLTYTSSNEDVVYFTTVDGKTVLNCGASGKATVTVKGSYNGKTYSEDVEIVVVPNIDVETITVKDAVASATETEVIIRGIVGPSLVNKSGFYLFDETGVIAVEVAKSDVFADLAIGNEVVIKGKRVLNKGTQIAVSEAEVLANYYGNNDYDGDFFITDKTLAEMMAECKDSASTARIYVLKGKVEFVKSVHSTNVFVTADSGSTELMLYCSGSSQYLWLQGYADKEVTLEIMICNWNGKGYKGAVLAAIEEDGTKVYNTLNFDN
jgi:uncharacterized protein YdeI (BOF family)